MSQEIIELTTAELDLVVAGRGSRSGGSTIIIEPVIQLNLTLLSNDALAISLGGGAIAIGGNSSQLASLVSELGKLL